MMSWLIETMSSTLRQPKYCRGCGTQSSASGINSVFKRWVRKGLWLPKTDDDDERWRLAKEQNEAALKDLDASTQRLYSALEKSTIKVEKLPQ